MAGETTVSAPAAAKADSVAATRKPDASHYEVLADTWPHHEAGKRDRIKGQVIPAAEVGPHWEWALENGVIGVISAKDAADRAKADPTLGDNAITAEDDAAAAQKKTDAVMEANAHDPDDDLDTMTRKAANRSAADVRRTEAAEARSNRENLRRI